MQGADNIVHYTGLRVSYRRRDVPFIHTLEIDSIFHQQEVICQKLLH